MKWLKQYDEVLDILGQQRTLVLSAHAHRVFREEHSPNISEVSVGALCGHWWTGERGEDGIPTAIQQCGTPPNYFVFDFNEKSYSFEVQLASCSGKIDTKGEIWCSSDIDFDKNIPELQNLGERTIIANIYGTNHKTSSVEISVDGINWAKMEGKSHIPPSITRLIYLNKEGDYPSSVSRRQPLRRLKSNQIWEYHIPEDFPTGTYKIRLLVRDSKGLKPIVISRIINI